MKRKITEFQKKVYSIVMKIPRGKTKSYKKIAKILGTSPRSVGRALSKNRDYENIPCHRVIKSNGNLGGYNRGIKKKMELLKKEKAISFT